jgi:hypothetical protein
MQFANNNIQSYIDDDNYIYKSYSIEDDFMNLFYNKSENLLNYFNSFRKTNLPKGNPDKYMKKKMISIPQHLIIDCKEMDNHILLDENNINKLNIKNIVYGNDKNIKKCYYHLVSVIYGKGNKSNFDGHYVCMTRDPKKDNGWWYYDDLWTAQSTIFVYFNEDEADITYKGISYIINYNTKITTARMGIKQLYIHDPKIGFDKINKKVKDFLYITYTRVDRGDKRNHELYINKYNNLLRIDKALFQITGSTKTDSIGYHNLLIQGLSTDFYFEKYTDEEAIIKLSEPDDPNGGKFKVTLFYELTSIV